MCDFLLGDWKLDTSDNFENLMKELGVGFVLRKIGNSTKPNIKFEKEGDEWTQTTTSAIKTHQIKFILDQEFKEETLDGRKCLSTCSVVDGKFVHTQKDEKTGKVQLVTTRELESPGVVKAVSFSLIYNLISFLWKFDWNKFSLLDCQSWRSCFNSNVLASRISLIFVLIHLT